MCATGLTIGNFDGVHRGHVELVKATRSAVGPAGRVVALSFDPHPISILRPDSTPARLTRFDWRKRLLQDAGADEVVKLTPTNDLLGREPVDFIRSIAESHSPKYIVEGPDFRFGRGRTGSVETLREHEASFGYQAIIIDPIEVPLVNQCLVRASSTMIRWLIQRGRVEDACNLLGRTYAIVGTVVRGDRRGRTIGVPTANIDHGDLLLPADGVYSGRATLPTGERVAAAISIGTKPTFGSIPRICEAHLIDFDGPLDDYGWTIELEFHHWLRDQLTYRDVDSLISQLQRDIDPSSDRRQGRGDRVQVTGFRAR